MNNVTQNWLKKIFVFLLLIVIFQGVYSAGKYNQYHSDLGNFISSIEKRVSLDLAKLRLANKRFNTVAHETSVRDYIDTLNLNLSDVNAPVRLVALQQIKTSPLPVHDVYETVLNTSEQAINLKIAMLKWPYLSTFSPHALLLALFLTVLSRKVFSASPKTITKEILEEHASHQTKLIVNLHSKSLSNGLKKVDVELPNKPFCFYVALLDYCINHKEPYLNHSKNVPDELLSAANKYFYRLIELGHTKRKKPDFSTNLDKTLSEIRAALDMVFLHSVDDKELFYPPKAQGEGSRSKLHNYALEHVNPKQIEFIGR